MGSGSHVCAILGERPFLFEPFLAAAVNEANILVAVVFQLPEGVGGEPVVVVAVEQNGGVVGNAGGTEKFFESGFIDQIAPDVVLELSLPVPANGAAHVPLLLSPAIHIHSTTPNTTGI